MNMNSLASGAREEIPPFLEKRPACLNGRRVGCNYQRFGIQSHDNGALGDRILRLAILSFPSPLGRA